MKLNEIGAQIAANELKIGDIVECIFDKFANLKTYEFENSGKKRHLNLGETYKIKSIDHKYGIISLANKRKIFPGVAPVWIATRFKKV